MTFDSIERGNSAAPAEQAGACFSPDDIGYARVISNAVSSADRNSDRVTTKDELGAALSKSTDDCQSKYLKAADDNFEQLANMAPEGLSIVNLADSPNSGILALGETVFADRRSNASGISQKDLEVAEMVVDSRKSGETITAFDAAVENYQQLPFVSSFLTGMSGGFLSVPQTLRGPKPTLISLGITGVAVAGQLAWGAYRYFTYESEVPEVERQIESRKQLLSNMRIDNNSK